MLIAIGKEDCYRKGGLLKERIITKGKGVKERN